MRSESEAQAEAIVARYAFASLLPGVVPIPWVDVVLVSGVQLKMLQRLARLYGIGFSEELGRAAIASLIGSAASVSLASVATKVLTPVPIVGKFARLATTMTFAAASTAAVGQVFIQHFESGGTFLTFDPERVRAYYRAYYAQPLSVVSSAQREPDAASQTRTD